MRPLPPRLARAQQAAVPCMSSSGRHNQLTHTRQPEVLPGWKPEIQVSAERHSPKGSLLGMDLATHSRCSQVIVPMCVPVS